ncbi:hypothetical protein EI77_00580 [Prosthecobacter fusiformis]|uniref:Uncharacterized protein n=1 Tax=Prosthecobacter fusiformis TaxID=48464 RepID=A0A4R7SSS9_9BACT|nr:hypothetical protein [Prosthecobacter fusiformis]TDU81277.1 hypothetical protein EI77_00580 [Prosthecobacter fusiformis]
MSSIPLPTYQLDEAAYQALLTDPMDNVTEKTVPLLDIWPYVLAVPKVQLLGHQIWDDYVECIYRPREDRFDLIHVCTRTPNVFLVIIVDRLHSLIHGHHLLDLNRLYCLSLDNPSPQSQSDRRQ